MPPRQLCICYSQLLNRRTAGIESVCQTVLVYKNSESWFNIIPIYMLSYNSQNMVSKPNFSLRGRVHPEL